MRLQILFFKLKVRMTVIEYLNKYIFYTKLEHALFSISPPFNSAKLVIKYPVFCKNGDALNFPGEFIFLFLFCISFN